MSARSNLLYMLSQEPQNAEYDRLMRQSDLVTKTSRDGHLLHPLTSSRPVAIADIGCGTGIWLHSVARHGYDDVPQADVQLVGFDIDSSRFMKNPDDRVEFVVHDCTKPIDQKFHGKFDYVNLTAMVYGITELQWPAVISNVLSILKPGGYFDWREGETWNTRPTGGMTDARLDELLIAIGHERVTRGLVPYMPPKMLELVFSAPGLGGDKYNGHRAFNILEFALTPINTPDAIAAQGYEAHHAFSEALMEGKLGLLRSSIERLAKAADTASEPDKNRLLAETVRLRNLEASLIDPSSPIEVMGWFPRLLAQKATGTFCAF